MRSQNNPNNPEDVPKPNFDSENNPKEDPKNPLIWNTFKTGKPKNKNSKAGHRNLVLKPVEKSDGVKVPQRCQKSEI